ncbi:MAG: ferritin [Deltaproteobacteria bacterium]|nr:ferritin [Deltaproteobacteria bacterium]
MANDTLHEEPQALSGDTRDLHRALTSLREELEAIDAYRQRADAASDPQLRAVMLHNRDEEIEHASMLMEWLRRHCSHFDVMMKTYLFTAAPIVEVEKGAATAGPPGPVPTLGIGSMKGN